MWHFEQLPKQTQPDLERFLAALNRHADFFAAQSPVWAARAPGRLDLMGGIADYSGSLVLELPLAAATWVAIQATTQPKITILSTDIAGEPELTWPLATLEAGLNYAEAHTLLTADPQRTWAAYVLGVLIVLQQERGLMIGQGLHIFIHSEVPAGKGVSSSAALEVASMQAISALYNLPIEGRELAILCQIVENRVVGAPCGIMDQMTSACGKQDSLLALRCQPAELEDGIVLPPEVEVWGIDSGIRHAVTGADYGSVRIGAFMGYRIIADLAGLTCQAEDDAIVALADPHWHGYLANIAPSLWETAYRAEIPEQLDGATFLKRYKGSTDTVTRIDPARTYAIRQPTAHPIYENHRVQLFRSLLQQTAFKEEQLVLLGELMYQSHSSYSACGLGSGGTDQLVKLVRQAGPTAGLYGAKITGGGSGGTVAVLARRGARGEIEGITKEYTNATGLAIEILGGSSPGAKEWGQQRLVKE